MNKQRNISIELNNERDLPSFLSPYQKNTKKMKYKYEKLTRNPVCFTGFLFFMNKLGQNETVFSFCLLLGGKSLGDKQKRIGTKIANY